MARQSPARVARASDNLASRLEPQKDTSPAQLQHHSNAPVLDRPRSRSPALALAPPRLAMSDQLKDLADVPKDFIKDGTQFINR